MLVSINCNSDEVRTTFIWNMHQITKANKKML